jgi:type IV pilus assembly protein PilM
MIKAAGINANCATLAVGGPTVQVRPIQMPKMNDADLIKSAKYEASRYISSNLDESALACEVIGPSSVDPEKMEVMLIAAPREMVNSRVEAVEMAGLEAIAVDTEAFALQRSIVDANRLAFNDANLRALVDIGATHTEVTLLSGPKFALTRSVPIAGATFTDALKNYLRVDEAEAERRKTEVSLFTLLEGGEPEAMEAARSVQTVLDELLREVRRSVNYYQSQGGDAKEGQTLSQILLAGGSAQMAGIAPYVTARLTVEATVVNPFAGSTYDAAPEAAQWLSEQAPRLGVALGLSVKEFMSVPVSRKG